MVALTIAKIGYLFILFLPTTIYYFVVELTGRHRDRALLLLSYGYCLILAIFLITTEKVVAGHYAYFFGSYPKAGILLSSHVVQTILVVLRSLWILANTAKAATEDQKKYYWHCFAAIGLYSIAAVDYLANYGIAFYPPGVIFIAVGLGILAVNVVRNDWDDILRVTALSQEVRSSLLSLRLKAEEMESFWPSILKGYKLAVQNGLCDESLTSDQLEQIGAYIQRLASRDNESIISSELMAIALMKTNGK
jgi:hypothetical protein